MLFLTNPYPAFFTTGETHSGIISAAEQLCCIDLTSAPDLRIVFKRISLCLPVCLRRRHKQSWGSGAHVPADPHDDPASPRHEALPAVSYGDPTSSTQHEPLP